MAATHETYPSLDLLNMPEEEEALPTVNLNYVTDVKSDILGHLRRITGFGIFIVLWIFLTLLVFGIGTTTQTNGLILGALGVLLVGTFGTHFFLQRESFNIALRTYTIAWMVGISLPLYTDHETTLHLIPFIFPVAVFLLGLLQPIEGAITVSGVMIAITLFIPALYSGTLDHLSIYQSTAVLLIIFSTSAAIYVNQQLFQVADWALLNYQRERLTADELFTSRIQLKRSLDRSRELSRRLQETNTALETATQFRGQFLANMSHELRTPLNAILGFSETMLSFPIMYNEVALPNDYRQDMNQIFMSGQQLLTVINDILDLSKVDAGKLEVNMQSIQPQQIIDNVLATAAGLLGNKPIELRTDLASPQPSVWADGARLQQVLLNLFSNAIKFTDQGHIVISTREIDEGIQFTIIDTGSGIAEDNLENIFEEFKQAGSSGRDPRAGAGLGLSISRQLVTLMGGRIWVDSVEGQGSQFHFILQPDLQQSLGDGTDAASIVTIHAP